MHLAVPLVPQAHIGVAAVGGEGHEAGRAGGGDLAGHGAGGDVEHGDGLFTGGDVEAAPVRCGGDEIGCVREFHRLADRGHGDRGGYGDGAGGSSGRRGGGRGRRGGGGGRNRGRRIVGPGQVERCAGENQNGGDGRQNHRGPPASWGWHHDRCTRRCRCGLGNDPRRRHECGGARPGDDRRAQRDRVLRMRVGHRRPSGLRRDHPFDQRNPGRPADQQHPGQLPDVELSGVHRPDQGADRGLDRRADESLELGPGEAGEEVPVRQQHRNRRLGVGRQRLLGLHAFLTQPGHGRCRRGRGQVEVGERATVLVVDPLQDRLVEVDAAEPFHSVRVAHHLDGVAAFAQHRGVEGAAAEVVDREGVALAEQPGRAVERGRRLRLGQRHVILQPGQPGDLLEQFPPVRPPGRRTGQRHPVRRAALDPRDGVEHVA